ncbi:hypothetical protein AB205_0083520 [Aquarana catesbeiana]|uniref:Nurim n=1 Tax=Aquarana catesbeiana TaxID=8400 RepID=A0A2G9RN32_AQUCT|nr:hypothetical protein AB205_0083520 [Aquarana catesbeiana]
MSAGSEMSGPVSPGPSMPVCALLGLVSLLCFVAGFGTGVEFVRFLSFGALLRNISEGSEGESPLLWKDAIGDSEFLRSLGINLALLLVFVFQHSLMAWPLLKEGVTRVFGVLQRSVYILCTAVSLQVYYHCFGMGDPLSHKSPRAARLYAHLRHPVFLELLVILWVVPSLPPDRLLLASALTLYVSCVHRLDVQDYSYLRSQLEKKFSLFTREEANTDRETWKND